MVNDCWQTKQLYSEIQKADCTIQIIGQTAQEKMLESHLNTTYPQFSPNLTAAEDHT